METTAEIIDNTRYLLSTGDFEEAARQSGEAVARAHSRWGEAVNSSLPSTTLLVELFDLLDNHLKVLITQGLYTEIFTTSMVALAQSTSDPSFESDEVAPSRMLLLADAVVALIHYANSVPMDPDSPQAEHLANMIIETSSLLFNVYKRVNEMGENEHVKDIYDMLYDLKEHNALRSTVMISGNEVPIEDSSAVIGDLLGRALAMGWINDEM